MKPIGYLTAGMLLGLLVANCSRTPRAEAPDPVQQSPQYYRVLIDNDVVRVLEYRLKPGEREPMHRHPSGVVHVFSGAHVRTAFPDGRVTESFGTAGTTWREPTVHALENVGDTEAHALAVELKRSCR